MRQADARAKAKALNAMDAKFKTTNATGSYEFLSGFAFAARDGDDDLFVFAAVAGGVAQTGETDEADGQDAYAIPLPA